MPNMLATQKHGTGAQDLQNRHPDIMPDISKYTVRRASEQQYQRQTSKITAEIPQQSCQSNAVISALHLARVCLKNIQLERSQKSLQVLWVAVRGRV